MSFNYQNIENGVCELNREVSHASIVVALTARRGFTFGQFVDTNVSKMTSFTSLFNTFFSQPDSVEKRFLNKEVNTELY